MESAAQDVLRDARVAVAEFGWRVQHGDPYGLLWLEEFNRLPAITTVEEFDHFSTQLHEMRVRSEHPKSFAMTCAVMLRLSEFIVILNDGVPIDAQHPETERDASCLV